MGLQYVIEMFIYYKPIIPRKLQGKYDRYISNYKEKMIVILTNNEWSNSLNELVNDHISRKLISSDDTWICVGIWHKISSHTLFYKKKNNEIIYFLVQVIFLDN